MEPVFDFLFGKTTTQWETGITIILFGVVIAIPVLLFLLQRQGDNIRKEVKTRCDTNTEEGINEMTNIHDDIRTLHRRVDSVNNKVDKQSTSIAVTETNVEWIKDFLKNGGK